uniref:Uncharacterized protein n=1 Tax=Arundo donax TaxID=35708 RepID=A0A0A9GVJ8_ARUDO
MFSSSKHSFNILLSNNFQDFSKAKVDKINFLKPDYLFVLDYEL